MIVSNTQAQINSAPAANLYGPVAIPLIGRPLGPWRDGAKSTYDVLESAAESAPDEADPPNYLTECEETTPHVITRLAELPHKALLDEYGLADELGVTTRTIRRMVGRYEIPPGFILNGKRVWMAGIVLDFLSARAEREVQVAERRAKAFLKHSA